MVICCAAPNCTNRQGKGTRGAVSFHRFPLKDAARLGLWTAAIQRSDWTPGPYSFLCSEHFSLDSFVPRMPDQHPILRSNAVPSYFQSGKKSKRSAAAGPHIFQNRRRKRGKKRPPSVTEKNIPVVLLGESESRHHTDLSIKDHLTDNSSQSKQCKSQTASKFIFSLHSYSRSSTPPQKADSMDPSPPSVEEVTQCACPFTRGENDQHVPSPVQDTGHFSVLPCHAKDSSNSMFASMGHISLQTDVAHSDISESPSYEVEQNSVYQSRQNGTLPQASDSLDPDTINSLHSYCSIPKHLASPMHECRKKLITRCRSGTHGRTMADSTAAEVPPLNPAVAPLSWMLGTWVSEPAGKGEFPSIPSFQYMEEAVISHAGQPMLNFTFCASNTVTGKAMHRECGFIRVKPGTNQVAFVCAQNLGVVEVEEGEVLGEQLTLNSHSISRISFAKEPHVQKISRTFRLTPEGKLEQTVSMETSTQPMAPHLHVTYKKVTS